MEHSNTLSKVILACLMLLSFNVLFAQCGIQVNFSDHNLNKCGGSSVNTYIGADDTLGNGTTLSYQWQIFDAGTWVPFTNGYGGNVYSASTQFMSVSNLQPAINGRIIRCYITGPCGDVDTSVVDTFKIKSPGLSTVYDSIPVGGSYVSPCGSGWATYTTAGIYTCYLYGAAASGCDSIIELHLSVVTGPCEIQIDSTREFERCTSLGGGLTLSAITASVSATPTPLSATINYTWEWLNAGSWSAITGSIWGYTTTGENTFKLNVYSPDLDDLNGRWVRCRMTSSCGATDTAVEFQFQSDHYYTSVDDTLFYGDTLHLCGNVITANTTQSCTYTSAKNCDSTVLHHIHFICHNVIYVNGAKAQSGNGNSWATAFKHPSEALDYVNFNTNGCLPEVWVAQGTYYPTASNNVGEILKTGVKLFGGFIGNETQRSQRNFALNKTILDGDVNMDDSLNYITLSNLSARADNGFIFKVKSDINVIDSSTWIDGFVLQNGNSNGGGGIAIEQLSGNPPIALTLQNCDFLRNSSSGSGGAIHAFNASLYIDNCNFTNNFADQGAAILVSSNSLWLKNSTFVANYADALGAIDAQNLDATITNVRFTANRSAQRASGSGIGGACYFNLNIASNKKIAFKNCVFDSNQSNIGGAIGLDIYLSTNNSLTISNCIFNKNTAFDRQIPGFVTPGIGGAIFVSSEDGSFNSLIQNTAFTGNSTDNLASAIAFKDANNSGVHQVHNCSFSQNKKRNALGANAKRVIEFYQANPLQPVEITNCIFGNDSIVYDPNFALSYSLINDLLFSGNGNIISDNTKYIDSSNVYGQDGLPFTTDDGLHTKCGSSAINSGTSSIPLLPFDLSGQNRVVNTIDMGAYENAFIIPTITPIAKLICTDSTYFFNGTFLNVAGIYFDTLQNQFGCDSIIELTLTTTACTGATTWLGNNSDWADASNWSGGVVPSSCNFDVIIPDLPIDPILTSDIVVGTVSIAQNATLTLQAKLSVCKHWTGGNTTSAIVTGTGKIILNGNALQTISGETQFATLQIDNAAGITLASGAQVSITDALELKLGVLFSAGQSIVLKSTSASNCAIINDFEAGYTGAINGNIIAERFVPVVGSNQHYISSPVQHPAFSQLGATGPNNVFVTPTANCDETQSAAGSAYGTVFEYVESNAAACPLGNWKVKSSGTLQTATGYAAYLNGNNTFSLTGLANTAQAAPYYLATTGTNTGWADATTLQGNTISSGWNLTGNPFPSVLDMTIDRTPQGFDNQVQVWISSGPYQGSWQPSIIDGTSGSAVVAPFQGVMIHKTAIGTSDYRFYQSERTSTLPASFYKIAPENKLVLELNSNGLLDKTTIQFNSQASSQFDPAFDANKINGVVNRMQFYSKALNGNTRYSINTLPSLQTTTLVPLGFKTNNAANFTISPKDIASFDESSYLFLEDKKNAVMHNLRSGDYTFTATATDSANRFLLHFSPPVVIDVADETCKRLGAINIAQSGVAHWNCEVKNGNGTIVKSGVVNSTTSLAVALPSGIYNITFIDTNGYTFTRTKQVNTHSSPFSNSFTASKTIAKQQEPIEFSAASSSTSLASVSWDFGDGNVVADSLHLSHAYAQAGRYIVALSMLDTNGCASIYIDSVTIEQSTATSIDAMRKNRIHIDVYPNPATDGFVIVTAKGTGKTSVALSNILGKQLIAPIEIAEGENKFSFGHLSSGVYLLEFNSSDWSKTVKLIVP